ncbi:MAG: hypothetical protein ACI9E1_000962 [Cryomorphaceae bacterium]|jgi:hypothetical protein
MRKLFFTILLSLCATVIHAQNLHFKYGRAQSVIVKGLDIDLEVTNNIVRTTITANFYNPRHNNQEGEINIPLPPGATISGYELEINGEMRQASVVDKDKALRAYEEIKARNVDPGLVEKKANNNFKIRVFPIPGQKTKRTKLTFVYRLPKVGDNFVYQLPLKLTSKVRRLNITVTGDCRVSGNDMVFKSNNGKQTFYSEATSLTDTISLSVPFSNKATLTNEPVNDGEQVHALYTLPIPKKLAIIRPYTPKKITILWDTSDVANDRKPIEEIQLLEQYFQKNRNTEVTLCTIGYNTHLKGSYKVIDGEWGEIKAVLKSLHHDGAAKLTPKIPDSISRDEFTLIFSSNKPQIHLATKLFTNLKIINSTQNFIAESLITELSQQRLSVISPKKGQLLPSNDPKLLHYFITSPEESLTISVGYGNEVKHTFTIDYKNIYKTIHSPLNTIIAQENLLNLQRVHAPKNAIIDYCIKHRLTSDHTSMIVLETMSDYVRYKIEPKDPTMLASYKRMTKTRKIVTNRQIIEKIPPKTYLWHLQYQLPAIKNIETFKLARDRFFLKGQYDPKKMEFLERWKAQVEKHKGTKSTISTQKEYLQWTEQVSKLNKQRLKFFSEKVNWPNDKDIFVSLRGIVPEQKIHQLKPNTDLKKFLHNHDLQSVALYRNSHRVIYNLSSDGYQKTPLLAGDMIVALEKRDIYYSDEDNPRKQRFITDDGSDLSMSVYYDFYGLAYGSMDGFSSDPFGGGGDSSNYIANSKDHVKFINKNISPVSLQKTETSLQSWKEFNKNVNQDAQKSYLQLKSNSRQNNHFYIHAARVLYANKKPEIARKVLSNIMAGEEHKFTAKKRYLLWLIEFQDYQHVIEIVESFDPQLTNDTIRFLLIKAHLYNKSLTDALKVKLTKDFRHQGLDDLITILPKDKINTKYDIHITAVAETNGVSRLLKIDYEDTYTNGLPAFNIYRQGLYCMAVPGASKCVMRQAVPGEYKVSISNNIIATFQIDIVRFWGTPKAAFKRITIHTDGTSKWKEIHSFDHHFPEK